MAAEPKTRPTNVPVADFLAGVENARRRADAEVVRDMMADVSGKPPVMWGPSIVGFGSYRGSTGDWPRLAFSPRKAELVVYLMQRFEGRDELLARLGKHTLRGGCLCIRRLADVDQGVLREIAECTLQSMNATYPEAA